jgi:hypothetical protein
MPTVGNPNPWPLHDVTVCDRLPSGTTFVAASLGGKLTGRVVCWTIRTLPEGSKTVWIRVEPLLGVTGTLRDAATASATPTGGRRLTAHADAAVLVIPSARCGSVRGELRQRPSQNPLAVAAC